MEGELISVIIPIFNGEKYIEGLVKALQAQTYSNLEIIMVDDGSRDNTLDLCHKYTCGDSRFNIYTKENAGASMARNYGLDKANGEFIAFIDADDYIFPDYFNYLYSLIIKYNAEMSCCGYYKMWDSERERVFDNKNFCDRVFERRDEILKDLLYRKNITGYPYLKLYKKDVLNNIKFPAGIIYGEDAIFTFEALKACKKVVYGSRILYIYYQHSASSTHVVNCGQYKKSWKIHVDKILNYAQEEDPAILNAAYAKCFILAIDYCCRIWSDSVSKDLKKELLTYIKFADKIVLHDKECKKFNRVLALISCINPYIMIGVCILYNCIKKLLKFETRKSV